MPDRYWCTGCDVGYTDVVSGNCPHCGSSLTDMEGFDNEEESAGPQEYDEVGANPEEEEMGDRGGIRMDKKAA